MSISSHDLTNKAINDNRGLQTMFFILGSEKKNTLEILPIK